MGKVLSDRTKMHSKAKNLLAAPKLQPMSVFVHDTKVQAKYKSTVINAALSKARDMWSVQNKTPEKNDDIMKTEDTPFLRTPRTDLKRKRSSTPLVIEPVMIEPSVEEQPSPPKRVKLKSLCELYMVKLDTPIVKRRPSRPALSNEVSHHGTPQSILKAGSFTRRMVESRGESTTPEDLDEEERFREKSPEKQVSEEIIHKVS